MVNSSAKAQLSRCNSFKCIGFKVRQVTCLVGEKCLDCYAGSPWISRRETQLKIKKNRRETDGKRLGNSREMQK